MPHDGQLLDDLVTAGDGLATVIDVLGCGCDIVHVVVGVHPAGNGQTEQFQGRIAVLAGDGITVGQQGTYLNAADTGLEIKLDTEGLGDELLFGQMGQDLLCIEEDGVWSACSSLDWVSTWT